MGKGPCGIVRYPGAGGGKNACRCWSRYLRVSGGWQLTRVGSQMMSLLGCIAASAVVEKRLHVRFGWIVFELFQAHNWCQHVNLRS